MTSDNSSPKPPRKGTLPTGLVLIAALAAGLGLWAAQHVFAPAPTIPTTQTVRLLNAPRTLPPFTLASPEGTLDASALHGRWTLVFLGFTHCPDICPTTLADLAKAEKLWAAQLPDGKHPRILFVSVDPERDSPETTAKYARYFSAEAIGATGNIDALGKFASSLNMVFAKTAVDEDGNYSIDHTSWVALLDPQARLAGFIRPPLDPAQIAADLQLLVEAK